jgi:plasmid maintenance system killer protein
VEASARVFRVFRRRVVHALHGKLEGLHSVSINLSYRITLELIIQDQQIIPVNVGDHDAVY